MQKSNILNRYRELDAMLSFRKGEKKKPCALPEIKKQELASIDTLFCFGLTSKISLFQDFLHRKETRLIFVEQCLDRLYHLIGQKDLEKFFENERVELFYAFDKESCNFINIAKKCMILDLYNDNHPIYQFLIKSQIQNRDAIDNQIAHELIMKNFFTNLEYVGKSGHIKTFKNSMQGKSIVLCGPGPSLKESVADLQNLQNSAFIIAVGTGPLALEKIGVTPDYILITDPNEAEYNRFITLKNKSIPLIYTSRLHYKILPLFTGPKIYLPFEKGGALEMYMNKALTIGIEGLFPVKEPFFEESSTVTHLGLTLCQYLGAKKVFLCGIDLCLLNGQRYSKNTYDPKMIQKEFREAKGLLKEEMIETTNCCNKKVMTSHHFLQEKKVVEFYMAHYCHIDYVNMSLCGLLLKGARSMTLHEGLQEILYKKKFFKKFYVVTNLCENKIFLLKKRLHKSLVNCRSFVVLLMDENVSKAKKIVYHMDLKKEIAYNVLLKDPYICMCYDQEEKGVNLEFLKVLLDKYLMILL